VQEAPGETLRLVRSLLLAIVAFGIVGLGAELVLLEHWQSRLQWLPWAVLLGALPVVLKVWLRPTRNSVRALRVLMGLFVVVGALGLWLHWRGNALLELEMNPDIAGWAFVRRALFGGTPLLAPGALMHIGAVGLLATFRHSGGPPA
jgi:hypothetical protein